MRLFQIKENIIINLDNATQIRLFEDGTLKVSFVGGASDIFLNVSKDVIEKLMEYNNYLI